MAKHLLQPLQFDFSTSKDNKYNMVSASHPEHGEVGYMSWAREDTGLHQPGEIANVQSFIQRRGVATALYNHAMANAVSQGYGPSPLHSLNRTKTIKGRPELGGGAKWVDCVGGPSVSPRKGGSGI